MKTKLQHDKVKLVLFDNRDEMNSIICKDPKNWALMINNHSYGACIGMYNDDVLVATTSIAMYDDEFHIHLFQVRDNIVHNGIGTKFFNMIVELFNPSIITLDYLDYDAKRFWEHLGFVDHSDDGEYAMIKIIGQ